MPGYILHLTAAKLYVDLIKQPACRHEIWKESEINDFYIGNLLPDSVKDKSKSHFRDPVTQDDIIQCPSLEQFMFKYKHLMADKSSLGYFYHLYVDSCFFIEYMPRIVTFYDKYEKISHSKKQIKWVKILKSGKMVTLHEFFSEKYYYGDYTKMNCYLAKRFDLPDKINTNVINPGIDEVQYGDVHKIIKDLKRFMKASESGTDNLEVFETEDLIRFLNITAKRFVMLLKKNNLM